MNFYKTISFLTGKLALEATTTNTKNSDEYYGVGISDAGTEIPTRIVLWKLFGFQLKIRKHERGFYEGVFFFEVKHHEFLVDYDDYEFISIQTKSLEAFEYLKLKIKEAGFDRRFPGVW